MARKGLIKGGVGGKNISCTEKHSWKVAGAKGGKMGKEVQLKDWLWPGHARPEWFETRECYDLNLSF